MKSSYIRSAAFAATAILASTLAAGQEMSHARDPATCAKLMTLTGEVAREAMTLKMSAYNTPKQRQLMQENSSEYMIVGHMVEMLRHAMSPALIEAYSAQAYCKGAHNDTLFDPDIVNEVAAACNRPKKGTESECLQETLGQKGGKSRPATK